MINPRMVRRDISPSMIVVDDFLVDPLAMRASAIRSEFRRPLISSTPALVSSDMHPATPAILKSLGGMVGVDPDWERIESVHRFWGQSACGEFQLSLAHIDRMGQVHSHKNGEWVGVLYLSLPQDCAGRDGTYIVRHRRLGHGHFDEVGLDGYYQLREDSRRPEQWERVFCPEMRFNRIFLFDSKLFHAESPGFGCCPASGRLIQIFNFTARPHSALGQDTEYVHDCRSAMQESSVVQRVGV